MAASETTVSRTLQVTDLTIRFPTNGTPFNAVNSVSFSISSGEAIGILGESGCGKTTAANALLSLIPPLACSVSGSVRWKGQEILGLPDSELTKIRGREIAMIGQDPLLSLNPVLSIRTQIQEILRAHRKDLPAKAIDDELARLLGLVGLNDQGRLLSAFPHELSGGQLQRILIAQALAGKPSLLVADEPAASLDTILQREIISLLQHLRERTGMALILITHNPAMLARVADRILVMYAGQIVEEGPIGRVFTAPLHPYTRGLLKCLRTDPAASDSPRKSLPVIGGQPPSPGQLLPGCRFEPRCPDRRELCSVNEPGRSRPEPERHVHCFLYEE